MAEQIPRVAYFPDSFHEVNGVANTSRHFLAFARRHGLPFLCVRAGHRKPALTMEGSVWTLELPRGILSLAIEKDLRFDPGYIRHFPQIAKVVERFKPDVIHITGPSELGVAGAYMAHRLGTVLAASWHTNVHEYLARRSGWFLRMLPNNAAGALSRTIEGLALNVILSFYKRADIFYAPNFELCTMVEKFTGKDCRLMARGVDSELFAPTKRKRAPDDRWIVLGFVGRLSVEKNVSLLVQVQKELEKTIGSDFRFVIVGHGGQEAWLREHLPRAEFTGVLRGEELARAYAGMDVFVFPSHTDTFGNVVLEALASGVPAIVTPDGGPASIVRDQVTGRAVGDADFASAIAEILREPSRHEEMRRAARADALRASWDEIFEGVYAGYKTCRPRNSLPQSMREIVESKSFSSLTGSETRH